MIILTLTAYPKYFIFIIVQNIKASCDKSAKSDIKVCHFNLKSTLHVSGFLSVNAVNLTCSHAPGKLDESKAIDSFLVWAIGASSTILSPTFKTFSAISNLLGFLFHVQMNDKNKSLNFSFVFLKRIKHVFEKKQTVVFNRN